MTDKYGIKSVEVSTHSRPKAAGHSAARCSCRRKRFNTQPPEGGWSNSSHKSRKPRSFNTQPPEGGWDSDLKRRLTALVSTHSRPKAAGGRQAARRHARHSFNTQPPEGGWKSALIAGWEWISFNTQPPEGGWFFQTAFALFFAVVSTHSRPKAAGVRPCRAVWIVRVSTHSRPKAAGSRDLFALVNQPFQHTAARRRLASLIDWLQGLPCFNTQPPEGGWGIAERFKNCRIVSTHSRPKAAGSRPTLLCWHSVVSTHSRPKAAGTSVGATPEEIKVSTHSRPKAAGASLKSLAPSGFTTPISLSSQEKREREYNTAFSVAPAFAIS